MHFIPPFGKAQIFEACHLTQLNPEERCLRNVREFKWHWSSAEIMKLCYFLRKSDSIV